MISIEEAQKVILDNVHLLGTEVVGLFEGLGRTCAADLLAPWDLPQADNSGMDGYAFAHDGLVEGRLLARGFLPAGQVSLEALRRGEALRIMTGAPIPTGSDTVVPIEDVELDGDFICLRSPIKKGANVRPRGEDIQTGKLVIKATTLLRPAEIGMLSAMGMTSVEVRRRARVAIIATGDELIEPGTTPEPGKTINSNSFAMTAMTLDAGGEPRRLGIAHDGLEATMERIKAGLNEDMVVLTGGASVGDHDFVKPAIEALGGQLLFWKVSMKPGKPVAFGVIGATPVFALPGNPVAAMVAFELFVRPAILKAMGTQRIFRAKVAARLEAPLENKGNRVHMVRGRVSLTDGAFSVRSTGNQSSARLSSIVDGNGLIKAEPERVYRAGDMVEVMLLERDFGMLPSSGSGSQA